MAAALDPRASETLPAPELEAPTSPVPAYLVDAPSRRPTTLPEIDTGTDASLVTPLAATSALDLAVPVRRAGRAGRALDLRTSSVLLHIDGFSTVRQISTYLDLPVGEVIEIFLTLVADGAVALEEALAQTQIPPPNSGIFERIAPVEDDASESRD